MDPAISLTEERPTEKRPDQNIRFRITIESTVLLPDYWTQYCSGGLRQCQQLATAMDREKRWELAQIESNKKDRINLTPLSSDTLELYCTLGMKSLTNKWHMV